MTQRRPHYYERRAHAEGWDVEVLRTDGRWEALEVPTWNVNLQYRVVPDAEGWLPWFGGTEPPVEGEVEFKMRGGGISTYMADELRWSYNRGDNDIIAYRPIKPDPYAELKKAAADPTKQIRCCKDKWVDSPTNWGFTFGPDCYEIRDKPKTKKVKLLAWFGDGQLILGQNGIATLPHWKRVPSEDKEVEVEE